jgi:hypothetical protein
MAKVWFSRWLPGGHKIGQIAKIKEVIVIKKSISNFDNLISALLNAFWKKCGPNSLESSTLYYPGDKNHNKKKKIKIWTFKGFLNDWLHHVTNEISSVNWSRSIWDISI